MIGGFGSARGLRKGTNRDVRVTKVAASGPANPSGMDGFLRSAYEPRKGANYVARATKVAAPSANPTPSNLPGASATTKRIVPNEIGNEPGIGTLVTYEDLLKVAAGSLALQGRCYYDAVDGIPINTTAATTGLRDTYTVGAHKLALEIEKTANGNTATAGCVKMKPLVKTDNQYETHVSFEIEYYKALACLKCKIDNKGYVSHNGYEFGGGSLSLKEYQLHANEIVAGGVGPEVASNAQGDCFDKDTHELLVIPSADLDGRPYTRSEAVVVAACLGRHCNDRRAGPLRTNVCGPVLKALVKPNPTFQALVDWIAATLGMVVRLWIDRRARPVESGAQTDLHPINIQYNTDGNLAMVYVEADSKDRYAFRTKDGRVQLAWSTFGGLSAKNQTAGCKAVHGRQITANGVVLSRKDDAKWWYHDPCVRMGTNNKEVTDGKVPLACLCDARLCGTTLYSWYWCKGDE